VKSESAGGWVKGVVYDKEYDEDGTWVVVHYTVI